MIGATYISAGADISADGRYRYLLWREWRGLDERVCDSSPLITECRTCLFIMLNPSTADGERDDPTIRRCVGFARGWGYDRLEVVNLFAYRATSSAELLRLNDADEPYGVRNQEIIEAAAADSGMIVCAWGNHGTHLGQDQTVLGWLDGWGAPLMALGVTRDGHPRHPLYIRSDAKLVRMPELRAARTA